MSSDERKPTKRLSLYPFTPEEALRIALTTRLPGKEKNARRKKPIAKKKDIAAE